MVTQIITEQTGGILHLPDALEQHPGLSVCPYLRVSGYGAQTGGRGTPKLTKKVDAFRDEVRLAIKGKARLGHVPFFGVERGQVSAPRKVLTAAAEYSHDHDCILVATDLPRFIRSEAYRRHTKSGRNTCPTPAEFELLREMTLGVPLATLVPPDASEKDRVGAAIKRMGGGRPRVSPLRIYFALERLGVRENGKWKMSIGNAARLSGISKSTLQLLLASQVPPELTGGHTGSTWQDLQCPFEVYKGWRFGET
jgi:hypothetical protein